MPLESLGNVLYGEKCLFFLSLKDRHIGEETNKRQFDKRTFSCGIRGQILTYRYDDINKTFYFQGWEARIAVFLSDSCQEGLTAAGGKVLDLEVGYHGLKPWLAYS